MTIGPFRGGNVEATARAARYAVLPADVMTGHTADDQAVTIRERDSMSQERVALDQVAGYLAAKLVGA